MARAGDLCARQYWGDRRLLLALERLAPGWDHASGRAAGAGVGRRGWRRAYAGRPAEYLRLLSQWRRAAGRDGALAGGDAAGIPVPAAGAGRGVAVARAAARGAAPARAESAPGGARHHGVVYAESLCRGAGGYGRAHADGGDGATERPAGRLPGAQDAQCLGRRGAAYAGNDL